MRSVLIAMVFVVQMVFCGCSDCENLAAKKPVDDVRRLIQQLSTNVTTRTILASSGVRSNMTFVADKRMRLMLIGDWERALRGVSVDKLPTPEHRYAAVKMVSDILGVDVTAALYDVGCDYGEIWEVRFRALDWLDEQVRLMKSMAEKSAALSWREQWNAWSYYLATAEWRETIVENHERFDFDVRLGMSGVERIDEIRNRFEHAIGRPVRPRSEIKRLGHFHKVVRAHIKAERDAALKKLPLSVEQ